MRFAPSSLQDTYASPVGVVETRLTLTDTVVYLPLRKSVQQLYCTMSLRWWGLHRTQRPFRFGLRLNDANGIQLAFVDIPPFIMDCQGIGPPGALWEPPETKIGTPTGSYFKTVASGELILPASLRGDHGPCCR